MASPSLVVQTRSGPVRGLVDGEGGWRFRGIPYAAAPFGRLRFRPPAPATPWTEVLDATDFGPRPPQPAHLPEEPPWKSAEGLDSLTISVHTTGPDRGPLPVLVWVYGGAYLNGHAGNPTFDGRRVVAEGVVMVTFNYRVGFEGFGAVPGFPHNRGLLDQVAALDWVHHNIAGFGGDPDNVTVVGQSAGAGSLVALATMRQATGLFRRGIAQSVPGVFYSPELAAEVTEHIARAAEVDGGSGARGGVLARLAPERLVAAGQAITFSLRNRPERWGFLGYANTPFAPVVDGDVLPVSPFDALEDGAAGHLDLVVGYTRDEYQSFLFDAGALRRFSERDARRALATFGLPASAIDEYRSAHPDIDGSALYSMVCGDALFRVPSLRTAASHAAASNGGRTYLYEFAWPSPLAGGVLGACHAIDVPVVFGTFDSPFAQAWIGPDPGPEAVDLSRRMRRAWVEFVSTGDPGWPAYRPGEALAQVWGVSDAVVADPEAASRRIWRDHRFGAVPALGSAADERSTAQT